MSSEVLHVNRIKEKNHIVIKCFNNFNSPWWFKKKKTFSKVGISENVLILMNSIYKSFLQTTLQQWNTEVFHVRPEIRQGSQLLTVLFKDILAFLAQAVTWEKENERYWCWKKQFLVFACYMIAYKENANKYTFRKDRRLSWWPSG